MPLYGYRRWTTEAQMRIHAPYTMVVTIALVVSACGSASDVRAGAGDAGDVNVDPAVAVVVAALDAKNSYDLDGWLMAFEGGEGQGFPLFAEQILMNAEQQWEIVEPCQVTGEDSSDETGVVCVIKDNNGFWGVGGISDTKRQLFMVNADGLITNRNSFSSANRDTFNYEFHKWLEDSHPDVFSDSGFTRLSSSGPGFDSGNPDLMLIAVEYIEEFVAQSDRYPLDPSDQ